MLFRSPETYMQKMGQQHALLENKVLSQEDLPFEFMLGALRLLNGVPTQMFHERTGLSIHQIAKPIEKALQKKLLDEDPARLKASDLGIRYLNDLQELFLS